MALEPGTRFGSYEIIEPIGSGGMGEVYRATDTTLKRDVALKVLPQAFAEDADRLARFRREAELLASLNHPNIATVHGFERSGDQTVIVMELVEGPTLEERIRAGAIPVTEALDIAMQIANALEAAHLRQIVHRDLKPANVKLRNDGLVKVLDFGIAKVLDERSDATEPRSPSLTRTSTTRKGMVLGTAAYMSPEQARGKPVDQRTDIWSFACILYEMLTGQPVFAGEDDTSTLARILEREMDTSRLPNQIAPSVRQTLELCLRKDQGRRVADIRDVRLALGGEFEPPARAQPRARMIAGIVLAAVIAGGAAWLLKPGAVAPPEAVPPAETIRASIDVIEGERLISYVPYDSMEVALQRPSRQTMAFSPDGRYLVYSATKGEQPHLVRYALQQGRSNVIAGTEGALLPFFSPDSRSVGFIAYSESDSELKRADIETGEVRTIEITGHDITIPSEATASWSSADTILISLSDGIYELPANGGAPNQLTSFAAGEFLHTHPVMLPGRRAVMFTAVLADVPVAERNVDIQPLDGGERRILVANATHAQYVPTGHIVFARSGTLLAMPFDADSLTTGDTQAVVLEDVMYADGGGNATVNTGTAQVAVSASGALAYVSGGVFRSPRAILSWLDRAGVGTPLPLPPAQYLMPRLSRDGTRLSYLKLDTGGPSLWIFDLDLEIETALPTGGPVFGAIWSPDGSRLAFARPDLTLQMFTQHADGSGEPVPIGDTLSGVPLSWSRQNVLAFMGPGDRPRTIEMVDGAEPELFIDTEVDHPVFSPDGNWVAYVSSESGPRDVHVRPYPAGSPVQRVSTGGGTGPVWSPDGTRLYYRLRDDSAEGRPTTIFEVDIAIEPSFRPVSRPRALFSGRFRHSSGVDSFDISPDGERFVVGAETNELDELRPVEQINLVLNWFTELERLVPTER
jgi:WD40 repeat protein